MSTTIAAPATMGGTVELTGDVVGSFLVHRSRLLTFIDDDAKLLWSVTHLATGMRFPFEFSRKSAARSFAKDVEKLVQWSAVAVKMRDDDPRNIKGEWVTGKPTAEQTRAIYAAAAARGAHVP